MNYTHRIYKPIGFYTNIIYENETKLFAFFIPQKTIKNVYCVDIPNYYSDDDREDAKNRFKEFVKNHPEYTI
jgi:hypothetical protein